MAIMIAMSLEGSFFSACWSFRFFGMSEGSPVIMKLAVFVDMIRIETQIEKHIVIAEIPCHLGFPYNRSGLTRLAN